MLTFCSIEVLIRIDPATKERKKQGQDKSQHQWLLRFSHQLAKIGKTRKMPCPRRCNNQRRIADTDNQNDHLFGRE